MLLALPGHVYAVVSWDLSHMSLLGGCFLRSDCLWSSCTVRSWREKRQGSAVSGQVTTVVEEVKPLLSERSPSPEPRTSASEAVSGAVCALGAPVLIWGM